MILKSYKRSPHEKQQCLTLLILLGTPHQTFPMPKENYFSGFMY